MSRTTERHWVRVWFGPHVIAQYDGDTEHAEHYVRGMQRRFPGLKVTDDIVPPTGERPLSGEQGAFKPE